MAVDHDVLARWLSVYQAAPGHISLTAFRDGQMESHHYSTTEDGIRAAMVEADSLTEAGYDVYMRTTTVDADQLEPGRRGGADETVAVIGIGTDLDHAQGTHKRTDLPPTPQDALSLIDGMPEPTIIINSGGGFYAWWLFDQPSTDLDLCKPLLKEWNGHIIRQGAQHGWHVDQVGDFPRILRPVGTLSYKTDPPTPVVVHSHSGTRYSPQQLRDWLDQHDNRPPDPKPLPRTPADDPSQLVAAIKRSWTVEQELEARGIPVPASGTIRCPFPGHDDHTPSFKVYNDPDDGWACYGASCPSSGGGSVIDLAMHLDGVDVGQAIRQLAHRIGRTPPPPASPHLVDIPMPNQTATVASDGPQETAEPPQTLDDLDPSNPAHVAIWTEYQRIQARDHAYRLRDQQNAPEPPDFIRLDRMLQRPLDPITYRIVNLWPTNGRVMLVAQFKAGKSTLVGNVVRSLVDGVPFLGQHPVTPLEDNRTVALIDDELDDQTIQRWYADQQIEHTDRVHVVPLRGRTATFDIVNPTTRAMWAQRLRDIGAQVVVFDCLRPVLDALGLSEHTEAGQLLVAFDALLNEAGVQEAIVVHHMGHGAERGRGDSRLRDWPDAEWKIIRDVEQGEDDPSAPRFFSAYGRDVDEPERRLDFDPDTRMLTLGGGDRKTEKKRGDALTVVARLQEAGGGPMSYSQLRTATGFGDTRCGKARDEAVRLGWVVYDEIGGGHYHTLTKKGEMA